MLPQVESDTEWEEADTECGDVSEVGGDDDKYVVKHKSAKLLMTYALKKLEAALNVSHLILSASSQRFSYIELVC